MANNGWKLLKRLNDHYGDSISSDLFNDDGAEEAAYQLMVNALVDLRHACDGQRLDFAEIEEVFR